MIEVISTTTSKKSPIKELFQITNPTIKWTVHEP